MICGSGPLGMTVNVYLNNILEPTSILLGDAKRGMSGLQVLTMSGMEDGAPIAAAEKN